MYCILKNIDCQSFFSVYFTRHFNSITYYYSHIYFFHKNNKCLRKVSHTFQMHICYYILTLKYYNTALNKLYLKTPYYIISIRECQNNSHIPISHLIMDIYFKEMWFKCQPLKLNVYHLIKYLRDLLMLIIFLSEDA